MSQIYKSRPGKTSFPAEQVYDFLADFRNFEHLIPEDTLGNGPAAGDTCSCALPGVGRVGLAYTERQPHRLIRISGDSSAKIPFTLEVVLRGEEEGTVVELTLEASLNVFIRALAEKPLKEFLEIMISHIETFDFREGRPAE